MKCKTRYPQRELCFTLQFAFKTFLMPLLWILKTVSYMSSLLWCHYLLCVPPSKIRRWLLPRWMFPKILKKLLVWWQKHYWHKHRFHQASAILPICKYNAAYTELITNPHQSKLQMFCWCSFVVNTLKCLFRSKLELLQKLFQWILRVSGLNHRTVHWLPNST